jgi:hypothetical protein
MDPLVGTREGTGQFTIPRQPIRRRLTELPRFLPGLRALRWLADLDI